MYMTVSKLGAWSSLVIQPYTKDSLDKSTFIWCILKFITLFSNFYPQMCYLSCCKQTCLDMLTNNGSCVLLYKLYYVKQLGYHYSENLLPIYQSSNNKRFRNTVLLCCGLSVHSIRHIPISSPKGRN